MLDAIGHKVPEMWQNIVVWQTFQVEVLDEYALGMSREALNFNCQIGLIPMK